MNTTKTVDAWFALGTPAPLFWTLPGFFPFTFSIPSEMLTLASDCALTGRAAD
jgi:hypothetical protein